MKQKSKNMGPICHRVVAILQTAILGIFYEFYTKTIQQKQPRLVTTWKNSKDCKLGSITLILGVILDGSLIVLLFPSGTCVGLSV